MLRGVLQEFCVAQSFSTCRRCHEKTSYVSNYAFFTLLHEWVDRGQAHRLEKFLCVKFQFYR